MVQVTTSPKLIKQKRIGSSIDHPEDTGLDLILRQTVQSAKIPSDSVKKSQVLELAKGIVYSLETDENIIKTRQKTHKEFQANSELRNVVQDQTFVINNQQPILSSRDSSIEHLRSNAKSFINYVQKISAALKGSDETLKPFEQEMTRLKSNQVTELRQIVTESEQPRTLKLKTRLGSENTSYGFPNLNVEDATLRVDLRDSGRRIYEDSRANHYVNENLFREIRRHLGRTPTEKNPWLVRVTHHDDESTSKVCVKRAKLRPIHTLIESIKSFKINPSYKVVEKEFIASSHSTFGNRHWEPADGVLTKIRDMVSSQVYKGKIEGFDDQMNNFGETVRELRYLEAVSQVHDKVQSDNRAIQTTTPEIAPMGERITSIENMRDPNLVLRTQTDVIPNDVEVNKDSNFFLITGPNSNGKTTYQNGTANTQALFQAGWDVFAKNARLSPKDQIITHYVRPGDLRIGESRFQFELSRVGEIFDRVTQDSLVILDEMYTGTNPSDGIEESRGVIRQLHRLGATTFFSTHYHDLAGTVDELLHAQNLMCVTTQDNGDISYTFRITQGSTKESGGRYLASKNNLDEIGLAARLDERQDAGELELRT